MNARLLRSLRGEAVQLVRRKRGTKAARRAAATRAYRGLRREYVRLQAGRR